MTKFTLEKCKTKAAYSAKLPTNTKLDLAAIKKKYEVILETPVLLVVKVEDIEIIVHGYGELLFKECEDVKWMKKVAEEIYEVGLKNERP